MKTGTRKINFLLEPCKSAYLRREATRQANNRIIALNSYERHRDLYAEREELLDLIERLRYVIGNDPENAFRYTSQLAKAELNLRKIGMEA